MRSGRTALSQKSGNCRMAAVVLEDEIQILQAAEEPCVWSVTSGPFEV